MPSHTSIRSCADRFEAESIRIRLAEAGIRAIVTGTDMGTALGLGGAGTMRMVRVEVPNEDAERAAFILQEDARRAMEVGSWICSRCREPNEATFEVCWSCNKPRTEDDPRGPLESTAPVPADFSESSVDPLLSRPVDDGNPYRAFSSREEVRVANVPPESLDTLEEEVRRAFRAAVIGSFVFPPLVCLYSVYLLLTLPPVVYGNRHLRTKVIVTWILDIVLTAAWCFVWLNQLTL